ncbi:MAG: PIN domain-containing protein [Nanoarchaeota archaeon]
MKFVIDTNIIFSLFKSNSPTLNILKNNLLILYSPRQAIQELKKYSNLICQKSLIDEKTFQETLENLKEIIEFKEPSIIFEKKAEALIKDKKDIPFLALALELNIPIWTNDKDFSKIPEIQIYSTAELINFLKNKNF